MAASSPGSEMKARSYIRIHPAVPFSGSRLFSAQIGPPRGVGLRSAGLSPITHARAGHEGRAQRRSGPLNAARHAAAAHLPTDIHDRHPPRRRAKQRARWTARVSLGLRRPVRSTERQEHPAQRAIGDRVALATRFPQTTRADAGDLERRGVSGGADTGDYRAKSALNRFMVDEAVRAPATWTWCSCSRRCSRWRTPRPRRRDARPGRHERARPAQGDGAADLAGAHQVRPGRTATWRCRSSRPGRGCMTSTPWCPPPP